MNNFFILFLFFISVIICQGPYPIENEVLLLNEFSFRYAKKEFKYLIILFYETESSLCKEFIPLFEQVAFDLKKENFFFAKIDSIKGEKIINHYNIKTFPTVILFKKTEKVVYEGGRKAEEIERWIKEKSMPIFKKITSKRELEKRKKYTRVFLVYFGNDKKAINELILAERKTDENIPIYTIDSEKLIKENVNPEKNETFVMFKTFDDKKNVFKDKITAKNLIKFMNLYANPKVIEYSKETSHTILNKRKAALVIFSTKTERHYDDSLNLLNYMWKRIKAKIKLVVCDIKDSEGSKLAKHCNMTEKTIPKVMIVNPETENPIKYQMSGGINEENIMIFINNFLKGKLKPLIISQEVPNDNTGDLFILVGKTFRKNVLENDKDILIYFVSPSCQACEEFEPKLKELARKLKTHNLKLLMAKMDPTVNDVEGYLIHTFPTIKFYPGNAKDKDPLDFDTRKSIDDLYKFIKNNAYNKIIDEEDLKKNSDL